MIYNSHDDLSGKLKQRCSLSQRRRKGNSYPLLASFVIMINTLIEKPVESFAGLGITLVGVPVYYYWRNKNKRLELGIKN